MNCLFSEVITQEVADQANFASHFGGGVFAPNSALDAVVQAKDLGGGLAAIIFESGSNPNAAGFVENVRSFGSGRGHLIVP